MMAWEDIKKEKGVYSPRITKRDGNILEKMHGTKITLRKIQRKSKFSSEDIANSLSRIFIVGQDFKVEIKHNSQEPIVLGNERRYQSLDREIFWSIPEDLSRLSYGDNYDKSRQISGQLIAVRKPIPPKTQMRGITLFSRKKLVNAPEFFSDSASSHFFSYLTGWLEVDFIDELAEDVISTDRQSLNWEHEDMSQLHDYLRGLVNIVEHDWRGKRERKRRKNLSEKTIDIEAWFNTLPKDTRKKMEPTINTIVEKSELSEKESQKVIEDLYAITPEYPKYHWRHLHPEIRDASEIHYKKKDYYGALREAIKRYAREVKNKSGSKAESDYNIMEQVFGNKGILLVAKHFNESGCYDLETIKGIEEGQKLLSQGIIKGCRNTLSHEGDKSLKNLGLFTERDCLDTLSLLSHLFFRLDNAIKNSNNNPNEDKRTQSLRFLKKHFILPKGSFHEMEEIVVFPLLWSLYEHKYGNRIMVFEKLKDCLDKRRSFDSEWMYFQKRYAPNGKINIDHLNALFYRSTGRKFLEKTLVAENCCTPNKVKALLVIIYRLRNNFFHGTKWKRDFEDQHENFRHANKILRKIIELKS